MTSTDELNIEISQKIKELRLLKNLTQSSFGEKIGLTKQAISNVENALSRPSIEFLVKLVIEFHVNLNWLLAGIGEPFIQINDIPEKLRNNIIEGIKEVLKNNGI